MENENSKEIEGLPLEQEALSIPNEEVSGLDTIAAVGEEQSLAEDLLPDPNENLDPVVAIEAMLDSALEIPSEFSDLEPLLPVDGQSELLQASFQVNFVNDKNNKALAPILEKHKISAQASSISQLTEYQAISLVNDLRAAGTSYTLQLKTPQSSQTEDDFALGALGDIADPDSLISEGAPAVQLPSSEKDVLLFTGEQLPGFLLIQTLGIVSAHRTLARRLFREDELQKQMNRELEKLPNKIVPASKIESIFRELFQELRKNALSQGGNAVLAIKIEAFPETSHLDPALEQIRLVAFGTATVVEKN